MNYWNFRTVRHVNSDHPDIEVYTTVHEIHWEDGKPRLFNPNKLTVYERKDCERIAEAFDKPPAVEVDDSSANYTEFGIDYDQWKWLVDKDEEPLDA